MPHTTPKRSFDRSLMRFFFSLKTGSTLPLGLLALILMFLPGETVLAAATQIDVATREMAQSFEDFEAGLSLGANSEDLCAWENDLGFFLSHAKSDAEGDTIDCALRLKNNDVTKTIGDFKKEFQPADQVLTQELDELVAGYPIAIMTKAIAQYDREIAGLIVGIGKKESAWGNHTPKLNGDECYNFWGYRGVGTRGFTPDGYGCWNTPEEAVQTVGDRLKQLRDIRSSAEPERMVVWKCGSSCAGHSDESVRKWIADVNFYFREIAQK